MHVCSFVEMVRVEYEVGVVLDCTLDKQSFLHASPAPFPERSACLRAFPRGARAFSVARLCGTLRFCKFCLFAAECARTVYQRLTVTQGVVLIVPSDLPVCGQSSFGSVRSMDLGA